MANAAVTKAMGIAKNLVSSSKKFLVGVKASTESKSTVENTGTKIRSTSIKIKNENVRQSRNEKNIVESKERKERESKVETGVKPIAKRIVDLVIKKPFASFWKLIGAWIVKNLPWVIDQVEIFTKKVKIFVASVKSAMNATGSVFKSLGKVLSAFAKNVRDFDFTDKSGRIAAARNELDENVEEVKDSFAEMGAVWSREEEELDYILEKFESDATISQIRADIESGLNLKEESAAQPQESVAQPQTPVVGKGSKETGSARGGYDKLLTFISKGEGGYNAMNQGTIGNKIVGSTNESKTKIGKDLTSMTIGEIMKRQKYIMNGSNPQIGDYGIFAAGAYQIIPGTMPSALKFSGLKESDLFSKENQDKLAIGLINSIPAAKSYLEGNSDDEIGAAKGLSKMWASIPNPDTNKSAYGSGNAAGHTTGETFSVLSDTKKDISMPKSSSQPEQKPPNVQAPQPASAPTGTSTVKDEFMGGKSSKIVTTSKFGMRDHPVSGGYKMHNGIDLAPPGPGYRVALKVTGKVTRVDFHQSGYGNFVIITSKETGKSYMFAHLKSVYVKNGDAYTGQAIGEIGDTGIGTGIHLHYEVYIGGKNGKAINPQPYLNLISIGKELSKKAAGAPAQSGLSGAKTMLLDGLASITTGAAKVINNTTVLKQKEYFVPDK